MTSRRTPFRKPGNRFPLTVFAGAVILVAAGCSSGSSSGSDTAADSGGDLSGAQQECVDNADKYIEDRGLLPETLPEELTQLSKSPTPGLTITYVHFPAPSARNTAERMVELAPTLGWVGKAVSFDGSVEDANRKLLSAIDDSDIVLTIGLPPAAVQAPIQAAKEKGVLLMLDATDPPESVPGFGGTPLGGETYSKMGEPAAYMFMQATNCQGSMAFFGSPFDAVRNLADETQQVLEDNCEDCSFTYTDIPPGDIGSPAATTAIISKLQSDPSLDFAFFMPGDLAVGLEPALKQAGLDVGVGGALPTTPSLAALERGENVFWLGVPDRTNAYVILDTAARALDGGEPTAGDHYPVPIFTPDNIESTDVVPVHPTDIDDQFKKLWNVD